jgi:hypothetical protein
MVVQARSAANFFRCNISITGLNLVLLANRSIASPGIAELLLAELNRLDPHLRDIHRVG